MLPRKVIGKEIETKNECTLLVSMVLVARAVGSSSPVCAVRLAAYFCLPSPVKESILHTNFWLANP